MQPINFEGSNKVIGPPRGVPESECESVFAAVCTNGLLLCWRPDEQELKRIAETGQVWVAMQTHQLPPHLLTAHRDQAESIVGDVVDGRK